MKNQTDKIKTIIIDDEPKARILLKGLIEEFCENLEVVAECHDLPSGVKAIHKYKPDLIFLDIEMPGHSGLELLDFFEEEKLSFSIIFTTAYNQYAIRAFKLSAVDYLLKPISPDDLINAVSLFEKKTKPYSFQSMEFVRENLTEQNKRIAIPTTSGFIFISLSDILLFKADNNYTEVITIHQEKHLASRTLKNFEDALSGNPLFFRCHKSYMINTELISHYVKSDGGYIILKNKQSIPISPEKVNDLMKLNIVIKR
ncbi:MAG: response regulator [Bacteroidia bacterium]|nr:response regulator [Bacteroidia bacterium]